MLSFPVGAVLLAVALVLGVVLPASWAAPAAGGLSFLAAMLLVATVRRTSDRAGLWLVAGVAALLVAGGPLVVRDLVVRAVASEESCAVRSLTLLEGSGGRSGSGDRYRRVVECPSGPVTFDAAPSAIDRAVPVVRMLYPAGPVAPRPVDLLLPTWSAAIPGAGYVVLAAVCVAARRSRTRP